MRQPCVLRELGWDPGLCLCRPFPEGAGTSASPRPTALMGEDAWLCVLSTPQPGIWDPEEKIKKGALAADLENAEGPVLQRQAFCQARGSLTAAPLKMSREVTGLTL